MVIEKKQRYIRGTPTTQKIGCYLQLLRHGSNVIKQILLKSSNYMIVT